MPDWRKIAMTFGSNFVRSIFKIDLGFSPISAFIVENVVGLGFFSMYFHQDCKALLGMLNRRGN